MHLKNNTEHSSNTHKIKQYKNGVNLKKKKAKQDNDKSSSKQWLPLCEQRRDQ